MEDMWYKWGKTELLQEIYEFKKEGKLLPFQNF